MEDNSERTYIVRNHKFTLVVFHAKNTDIANYGVFCIKNMLFYYLTFHKTGLPNFWQKKNLKFFGGAPPSNPLK